MTERMSPREPRDRTVDADTVVSAFEHAPTLDWDLMREDLDAVADQDATPRI